jgi:hypothetical protein
MAIRKIAVCALAGAALAVGGALAQGLGGTPFDLPRDAIAAATAFQNYTANAAAVGRFSGSQSVSEGLRAGVAYEPVQLEAGMIAYGAIVALQNDAFVEGVNRAGGRGYGRQALAERLLDQPFEVARIDGSDEAARRVAAALSARAAPLVAAGVQVKASAYSVQHQAWSKAMVADAQGRLAEVKRLSATLAVPSDAESLAMLRNLAGEGPRPDMGAPPAGFSEVDAKALALAAEAVLGHAHGPDSWRLTPLLSEPRSAQCLKMAKLNLYQCMAVAGPQYEDIYCLGQHAMMDTGACVREAALGHVPAVAATAGSPDRLSYRPYVTHYRRRRDSDD